LKLDQEIIDKALGFWCED